MREPAEKGGGMGRNRAQQDLWGLHKTALALFIKQQDAKDVGVIVEFHLKASAMGISRPLSTRVKLARPHGIPARPVHRGRALC